MSKKIGFLKIERSLESHWLWKEKPYANGQAWIDLLMCAKYKDDKAPFGKDLIMLKRGQLVTSQLQLAEKWGWHRDSVRRLLTALQNDGMVRIEGNNKYTIITICNFDTYQGFTPAQATTEATDEQQQRQHQNGTVEEGKEVKNSISISSLVPETSGDATVKIKRKNPPSKPSEVSKGVPEWYVKMDTIYLANTATMMDMPVKSRVITNIFTKVIAARPDKATEAFLAKHPADATSFDIYNKMLQPYGIAKTLHVLVCDIRPPAQFKVMRETKVEKAIDHARMLLQIDKHSPARIKEVMDWMYEPKSDAFWRNTVMSIDGFRNHFDKIAAKMEDHKAKEAEKIHQPGFSLNHD